MYLAFIITAGLPPESYVYHWMMYAIQGLPKYRLVIAPSPVVRVKIRSHHQIYHPHIKEISETDCLAFEVDQGKP